MGSNTVKAHGAERHSDVLWFKPENVVLVTDPSSEVYDPTHDPKSPQYIPIEKLESMVLDVMEFGVQQPVSVRRNGKAEDGTPIIELADGRTRYRCLVEANARLKRAGREVYLLPAMPRTDAASDAKGWMELGVRLNAHRKHEDILVKADQARRLMATNGGDIKRTAQVLNIAVQTVRNYMHLMECTAEVQRAVSEDRIAMTVAIKMRGLSVNDQKDALAKLLSGATPPATSVDRPDDSPAAPAPPPNGEPTRLRGRAAHEAVNKITGKTERAPMRTRKQVEELYGILEKMPVSDAPSAKLVLHWVMGEDVVSVCRIIDKARAALAEADGE